MVSVEGRDFPAEILARIGEAVRAEPAISRRRLSRLVCEWLDWRNDGGRLQEMSCRKSLLALHRRGHVELPALTRRYSFQEPRQATACPPLPAVACTLAELGPVEIVRVGTGAHSALWRALLDAHHYLRSGPLCGAQLRYLVRSERYGWLGGLSYSACARRVESRDRYIGWSEAARRRHHRRVVNNSRFLIVPTVKVKCLASFVLARCQARLAADWDAAYGYRPVLLETYVERGRFAGTCYRAANWRWVGSSGGRGRDGAGASVKDVYLWPLTAHWQQELCREADGAVRVRTPASPREPLGWIEAELGEANMGDARLTARLLRMTGMFYDKPSANIPQAAGTAKAAKAAYRFLDNPNVRWEAILQPHYAATEARLREEPVVLVAQDSTSLNYSTHPHTDGLGPINDSQHARGLIVHDTLAFTPAGTPLGLLNLQCWAREGMGSRHQRYDKAIADKESFKWIESYDAVSAVQRRCRSTQLVVMADREADIHDLFHAQATTPHGAQLLIRAERSRNRQVLSAPDDGHEPLWPLLAREPEIGRRELLVPPNDKRAARLARLSVRTRRVTLKPPKRSAHLAPVPLWAVLAHEIDPPAGVEALEWMLLTTVAVATKDDAYQRLDWYARRWGIEVFHRILKSGCRVEARQLENVDRLRNCLAIDLIVAWRIHHLTMLGEHCPDVPCTVYFTGPEWRALTTFVTKTKTPPPLPPSLNEAVCLLGQLGGHLARAGDGHPGTEVLWRGMARLADIGAAYELYHPDVTPKTA